MIPQGWECHTPGCSHERRMYSWWCLECQDPGALRWVGEHCPHCHQKPPGVLSHGTAEPIRRNPCPAIENRRKVAS